MNKTSNEIILQYSVGSTYQCSIFLITVKLYWLNSCQTKLRCITRTTMFTAFLGTSNCVLVPGGNRRFLQSLIPARTTVLPRKWYLHKTIFLNAVARLNYLWHREKLNSNFIATQSSTCLMCKVLCVILCDIKPVESASNKTFDPRQSLCGK